MTVKTSLLIFMLTLSILPCIVMAQTGSTGIEFVDITGILKIADAKFVLTADDGRTYRVNCTEKDGSKYLNEKVQVQGILLQGYDNPKYGNQNLPIEKIDPKDVIYIITSVSIAYINK